MKLCPKKLKKLNSEIQTQDHLFQVKEEIHSRQWALEELPIKSRVGGNQKGKNLRQLIIHKISMTDINIRGIREVYRV